MLERTRNRSAVQRRAAHLEARLSLVYQSELFERGFGYLSDGGVSIGHRDPRLRRYDCSFGGWHQTLP
jgi:hypothetical protein